ncbi:hypothetical protein BSKO_00433 [Bryopsis sp. KO-2023]|nr:hypothetical protein BSKO_00433 [Bryopsis sp. KO-2023]
MQSRLPVGSDASGGAVASGVNRRLVCTAPKVVGPSRGLRARVCRASTSPHREGQPGTTPADGSAFQGFKRGYYVFEPTSSPPIPPDRHSPPPPIPRPDPVTIGASLWNKKTRGDFLRGAKTFDRQAFWAKYASLCKTRHLDAALELVEIAYEANRQDVLSRLMQKYFLRLAGNKRAVKQAWKFVELLPVQAKDTRTYNMLISVCVKSHDLDAALKVKDMIGESGMELDVKLFTNLISACASIGNVEQAFKLYGELKATGQRADVKVYGALCQTCAIALKASHSMKRRQQLVLVERSFNLLEDMREDNVNPDPMLWNILITCTSRAGQLQRTFEMLQRMQQEGCLPDAYTYSTLIDACTKSGDNELALKVYHRALLEGKPRTVVLYTAATRACISEAGADMEEALQIYNSLQRAEVEPDDQYFAALMIVAGRCGNVDLAFALQDEMEEQGIPFSPATCSALISAALWNDDVEKACMAYRMMTSIEVYPNVEQINSLIMACGASGRMGEVVNVVEEMIETGKKPDVPTYTAIISACQRAGEADLAFAVAREMLKLRLKVDEGICFCLLRVCYNGLVDSWYPDGRVSCCNESRQKHDSPFGRALLRALHGRDDSEIEEIVPMGAPELTDKAVAIYRSLLEENILPSMKVLNMLFSCLRIPQTIEDDEPVGLPMNTFSMDVLFNPQAADLHLGDASKKLTLDETELFDRRATQLVKEAIRLEALPPFSMDRDFEVNMLNMLPAVAEVYVLTISMEIKKHVSPSKPYQHKISFIVPEFNPKEVMLPSHVERGPKSTSGESEDSDTESSVGEDEFEMDESELLSGTATSSTGLGVLAMLRRLKIWCRVDLKKEPCRICVSPREITQWVRFQKKHERTNRRRKNRVVTSNKDAEDYQKWGGFSTPISDQQRDIRLGLGRQ